MLKGRKGVGKFAGIVIAGRMELTTVQNGRKSTVIIEQHTLESGPDDIDKIEVPVVVIDDDYGVHGTMITLTNLANYINYPSPAALRHARASEYGRQHEMTVVINGENLTHLQIAELAEPLDVAAVIARFEADRDAIERSAVTWIAPHGGRPLSLRTAEPVQQDGRSVAT